MPANTNATIVASSGKTHMRARIRAARRDAATASLSGTDDTSPIALLDRRVLREATRRHVPSDRRTRLRRRRGHGHEGSGEPGPHTDPEARRRARARSRGAPRAGLAADPAD